MLFDQSIAWLRLHHGRLAAGAVSVVTSALCCASAWASECDKVHDPIEYFASSGLLPHEVSPEWVGGCDGTQWLTGEIVDGLLWVNDDATQLRTAYCRYDTFDCSSQDAVFEIVAQAMPGADATPPHLIDMVWSWAFNDDDRYMLVGVTEDAVGFKTGSTPVDWLSVDGQPANYEMDTTDGLHAYRVEKFGQDRVELYVDGALRVVVNYSDLPEADIWGVRAQLSTSTPGVAEFMMESIRLRIGDTSFDDPLSPCDIDLDGDGVVGTSDLLLILGAWGTCAQCPEDFDRNGSVGTGDLLILLGAWGPQDGCGDDDGGDDGGDGGGGGNDDGTGDGGGLTGPGRFSPPRR